MTKTLSESIGETKFCVTWTFFKVVDVAETGICLRCYHGGVEGFMNYLLET